MRGTLREAAAEFLGTFVLIAFGAGVVAQVVLSGRNNGQYLSINVGWALGVTMGVYVTYREALDAFDGGVRQVAGAAGTAGIWATYPQPFLSVFPGGFIDQVVGTALLVGVIFALSDARNFAPPPRLAPLVIGLLVLAIGATFGYNSGYAINPARDLAPRLFTALAGWGSCVFTAGNGWWWVPVVAPCVGGVLGGYVYDLLIANHHPPEVIEPPPGRTSAGSESEAALS